MNDVKSESGTTTMTSRSSGDVDDGGDVGGEVVGCGGADETGGEPTAEAASGEETGDDASRW
jgi:hypothetical protein